MDIKGSTRRSGGMLYALGAVISMADMDRMGMVRPAGQIRWSDLFADQGLDSACNQSQQVCSKYLTGDR